MKASDGLRFGFGQYKSVPKRPEIIAGVGPTSNGAFFGHYCIVGGYFLMGSARCPIVLRIFKASRPLTSSVRCIDGVCRSGRVL